MKRVFNWILDKWLGSFLSGCALLTVKAYVDMTSEEKDYFHSLNWLKSFFFIQVSLWQVLIICTFLITVIIYRKKKIVEKIVSPVDNQNALKQFAAFNPIPPEYINYNKDGFGKYFTIWSWENNFDHVTNKFSISKVKPHCQTCDSRMKLDGNMENDATCSKCRLNGAEYYVWSLSEEREDVEDEIYRRIANGDWKKANERIKSSKLF